MRKGGGQTVAENQVVVFELSGVKYGIEIIQVQEIIRMVEVTPVAVEDTSTEGIINLRGQVIPVKSISRRLGLTESKINQETRVIVVELEGKKTGLIVDRVLEVGKYHSEELEELSGIGTNVSFLKGIVKKKENLWLVLDLNKVA